MMFSTLFFRQGLKRRKDLSRLQAIAVVYIHEGERHCAIGVDHVHYPIATASEPPGAGGLGLERNGPKWVGGRAAQGEVLTSGPRIKVPARTLLAFQIVEPLRLTGFRR
jgi:hypothetical protein